MWKNTFFQKENVNTIHLTSGIALPNFIPFVDYKERAQQWKWIGQGRDSDEELLVFYRHWLASTGMAVEGREGMSTPPPRM